jgi:hypothetical protein
MNDSGWPLSVWDAAFDRNRPESPGVASMTPIRGEAGAIDEILYANGV